MTSEPMDTEVPIQPRDRSAHGGAGPSSDDGLAVRTERERVAAGLKPYASEDVPPATDEPMPYDTEA